MKTQPHSVETPAVSAKPLQKQEPAFEVVSRELWHQAHQNAQLIEQLRDRLLRTQADWDNFRKRTQKEKEDAVKYAASNILEKILPVIDNFEMGLAAAQNATQAASICEGMSMVLNQLHALLRSEDVEVIDAIGKHFDPHLHEALGQVETTEHPEGTVVQQHRKGYKLKDRLLRPAAVLVAKAPH